MLAVRVLVACLCLVVSQCTPLNETPTTTTTTILTTTTTTILTTAPPGGQDNVIDKRQCKLQYINVTVMEDDRKPTVINYTVVANQPNNCGGYIRLRKCGDKQVHNNLKIRFKESGQYCVKEKGSYMLKYIGYKSECFNVSGTELGEEIISFRKDEVSVKFEKLPGWAKGINVCIREKNSFGYVSCTNSTSNIVVVTGNYNVTQQYHVQYSLILKDEAMDGECSTKRQIAEFLPTPSSREDPPKDYAVVIVGVIAGVCVLVLVVCAIKTCIRLGHNPSGQEPHDSEMSPFLPLTADKAAGDVVLIHAQDNGHLARLCRDLKDTITKECNRKVVDISLIEAQRQTSPEAWMLKVLSQPNNTVLLVMSQAVVALHRALQQGNDTAGCVAIAEVRGEMRPWDVLLPICLRYLQEHLSKNYERLLVVRFQQASSSSSSSSNNMVEDISELVNAMRFLLPQHQFDLQNKLKIPSINV